MKLGALPPSIQIVVHPNVALFLGAFPIMLSEGFTEIGVAATLATELPQTDEPVILLGADKFRPDDLQNLGPDAIIMNVENTASRFFTPEYIDALRRFQVWDYDQNNAEHLSSILGKEVRYLKMFYVPGLSRFSRRQVEDIDVLFYGAFCDRRMAIIDEMRSQGLCVEATDGAFGDIRDNLISRSKLVINIHYYDNGRTEMIRLFELLANGRPVLSEQGPEEGVDADLVGALEFAPYEALAETASALVHDDARRGALSDRAFSAFSARRPGEILPGMFLAQGHEEHREPAIEDGHDPGAFSDQIWTTGTPGRLL